jgi:hypothetical protein
MNFSTVGCADPRLTAQSAVPYGQAGENATRFPRLAHRSAAAHKLHSTRQQHRMILISGKGETSSRPPGPLAYSSPEAVQTAGTVADDRLNPIPSGGQERTVRSEYNRVWSDHVANFLSIVRDEALGDGSKNEEIDRDRGHGFEQSARCTR